MNTLTKILIAISSYVIFAQVATALSQSIKPSDYSVVAFKDCQVVSDTTMTEAQLDAYFALQQQEENMHQLELPLKDIESKAKEYSEELEKLAKLAIQDTDDSLYIDKEQLAQHDVVAEKLTTFMQQHQATFDALGKQGAEIGKYADAFESSIKSTLQGIDYDHIQVLTSANNTVKPYCDEHRGITIM